jgi:CheY-like chemotaxis protein
VTVIDPDQDVLDLYRELLTTFGYDVATYADVLPGIEQLIASRPDLIIVNVELDPQREQLTGLQVVHSARSSTPLKDVPIIISTTATERIAAALSDVMARGDVHRLEKPFDLSTFERVVRAALGESHGAADAPRSGSIPPTPLDR